MIKKAFSLTILLTLVACAAKPVGVSQGKLGPCPTAPRCVNSEYIEDEEHYIEPITVNATDKQNIRKAWRDLVIAIDRQGGAVYINTGNYLHAVFKTPLMRFGDDLEARFDKEEGVIHIRSASRIGYNDTGVNRRRVEALRAAVSVKSGQ